MIELSKLFSIGLAHPWAAPEHLLLLLAAGILAGQQGWRIFFTASAAFIGVLLAVLWLVQLGYLPLLGTWAQPAIVLLALAGVLALLLILRLSLPLLLVCMLAGLAALLLGMDLDIPRLPGLSRRTHEFLWGLGLSNSLVFVVSGLLAASVRLFLSGLVLRVLGAWLAAAAVLILALQLSRVL